MDRIYREQAIEETKKLFEMGDCYCDRASIIGMLNSLPSAEKTGEWLIPQRRGVMSWNEKAYAECSVCHEVIFNARSMKFCPQCGARMEVEE